MLRGAFGLAVVLALAAPARAQDAAPRLAVVTPKADGIVATGINGRGDVIGFEWVEDPARPGVMEQKPFLARGKEMTYLPLLKSYTATFPAAVSDDGVVVGRSSKPAPPKVRVYLRNQAFVWDAAGGIRGLGVPADDWASFATGITRDGRLISGFTVGNDRVRPCVWERVEGKPNAWAVTVLPSSPRLGSTTVAVSGNGRYVAAADFLTPCLWSRDASGKWVREAIGPDNSLTPRAVNEDGTVVGIKNTPDGTVHAIMYTRKKGVEAIPEPPGYASSEANAVNDEGLVVGLIDGPHGSKVGPNAFAYKGGRLRVIDEGGPNFVNATAVNAKGQVAGVLEAEEDEPAKPPHD